MLNPRRLVASAVLLALAASACQSAESETTATSAANLPVSPATTVQPTLSVEDQLSLRLEMLHNGLAWADGISVRGAANPEGWSGCDPADITDQLRFSRPVGDDELLGMDSSVMNVEVDSERNLITSYQLEVSGVDEAGESQTRVTIETDEIPIVEVNAEWYLDVLPCELAEELSLGTLMARGAQYWDGVARGDYKRAINAHGMAGEPRCSQGEFEELFSHMPTALRGGIREAVTEQDLSARAFGKFVTGGARAFVVVGTDLPETDATLGFEHDYLMFRGTQFGSTITADPCADLERLMVAYADGLAQHDLLAVFGTVLLAVQDGDGYQTSAQQLLDYWDQNELAQFRSWDRRLSLVASLTDAGAGSTFVESTEEAILLVSQSASGRWFCTTSQWLAEDGLFSASSLDKGAVDSTHECASTGVEGMAQSVSWDTIDVRAAIEWTLHEFAEVAAETPVHQDAADMSHGRVYSLPAGSDRLLLVSVSALGEWHCAAQDNEETRFGVALEPKAVATFEACWAIGVEGYWEVPPLDPRLLENLTANWEPVSHGLASPTGNVIQGRGTINIGYGISEPFAFADETGFEIDLGVEIVDRLFDGVNINWVPLSATERFSALEDGTVDLLLRPTTHTVAREEYANWTSPYYLADRQMVFPSSRPVTSIEDLDDRYVGIQWLPGFQDELGELSRAEGVAINVYIYESESEFVTALQSGTIDAAYLPTLSAAKVVYELGAGFEAVPFGEQTEPIAVATPLDDPTFRDEVDAVLREIIEDGTLGSLHQRWFGSPLPWTTSELGAVQPPE